MRRNIVRFAAAFVRVCIPKIRAIGQLFDGIQGRRRSTLRGGVLIISVAAQDSPFRQYPERYGRRMCCWRERWNDNSWGVFVPFVCFSRFLYAVLSASPALSYSCDSRQVSAVLH